MRGLLFLEINMTLKEGFMDNMLKLLKDLESSWYSFTGELCEQL